PLSRGRKTVRCVDRTELGGSRLPCRGQEAPQRALRKVCPPRLALSIAAPVRVGCASIDETFSQPPLPRDPERPQRSADRELRGPHAERQRNLPKPRLDDSHVARPHSQQLLLRGRERFEACIGIRKA